MFFSTCLYLYCNGYGSHSCQCN